MPEIRSRIARLDSTPARQELKRTMKKEIVPKTTCHSLCAAQQAQLNAQKWKGGHSNMKKALFIVVAVAFVLILGSCLWDFHPVKFENDSSSDSPH
jgi:hypothetical protein